MTKSWEQKYIGKRSKKKRIFRLNERVSKIANAIKKYYKDENFKLLEVGSGDGKFLYNFSKEFPLANLYGIEQFADLIDYCPEKSLKIIQGKAEKLPYDSSSFDIVAIPATIEHIKDVNSVLQETYRVLKPAGLLIITWPNPFWDKINDIFVDTGHCHMFTFTEMTKLLDDSGYHIIEKNGFMVFPFFEIPLQDYFERLIRFFKMDFLLFNYLICCRKK